MSREETIVELTKALEKDVKIVTIEQINDAFRLVLSAEFRKYSSNSEFHSSDVLTGYIENFVKSKGHEVMFNNSKTIFFFVQ